MGGRPTTLCGPPLPPSPPPVLTCAQHADLPPHFHHHNHTTTTTPPQSGPLPPCPAAAPNPSYSTQPIPPPLSSQVSHNPQHAQVDAIEFWCARLGELSRRITTAQADCITRAIPSAFVTFQCV